MDPILILDTPIIEEGGTLTGSINGFPYGTISIYVYGGGGISITGAGYFPFSFTVSEPPGEYYLVATDGYYYRYAPFTITGMTSIWTLKSTIASLTVPLRLSVAAWVLKSTIASLTVPLRLSEPPPDDTTPTDWTPWIIGGVGVAIAAAIALAPKSPNKTENKKK
jgi:hypothetical protein